MQKVVCVAHNNFVIRMQTRINRRNSRVVFNGSHPAILPVFAIAAETCVQI